MMIRLFYINFFFDVQERTVKYKLFEQTKNSKMCFKYCKKYKDNQ